MSGANKSFAQTGIDKSVPYIAVIMEKFDTDVYPKYELPAGYYFAQYEPGFEKLWAKMHYEIDHVDSLEEGETIFREGYLNADKSPDFKTLKEKTVFVMDENNNLAGTGSIWDGDTFGGTYQRLHWIGVAARHQNKGLAKAVISKSLDIYNNLGYGGYIYLTSQTWSYKALNIYMKFGFKPYMGELPKNWEDNELKSKNFKEKNIKAWDIINEKITQYRKS